jgi:hypothetical protein
MARGWESKSVEDQQAEANQKTASVRPNFSPQEIAEKRRREGLLLSRSRIFQQLQSATRAEHRAVLERALADLDRQLLA